MILKVDKRIDALYLRLDDSKIKDSEELTPGIIIDYNDENEVVGVEILNLSKRSHKINLDSILYETV
jgi:uncharacterized protein YuzE